MTDNEIIKALECCIWSSTALACFKCPMAKNKECNGSNTNVNKLVVENALDLINRQRGELRKKQVKIHKLLKELNQIQDYYDIQKAEIEKLTVNMNAFGLGMKIEAEKAERAQAEDDA